ncbi:MAG: F0F1 ATP synthase subunit A [Clostridia bacterium]|nr:F0F1 ATP synthase subunit A [Clostridia bacterium]MBQ9507438.1 F0F1 ATP synthase subunit A [Clostridia bacterium]
MDTAFIIMAVAGAVALSACLVGYIFTARRIPADASKKRKRSKKLWFMGLVISAWFLVGTLIKQFTGIKSHLAVEFEMFSERVDIFGFSIAKTTLTGAGVLLALILLLLALRIFAIPKFSVENPGYLQTALETAVEFIDNFVKNTTGAFTMKNLPPFMLSIAIYMFGCALSELFGLRAPTSDLTFTFALGLCTFVLLNYYGIRKNGFGGRLKNMGGPMPAMRPVMIPLKAVSDIAVPVSLACRLYGNMLGGLLVMDLLKGVLGGYGSGLPAVAGLWFNLIHPGIQIYIFVMLSLTFINEAMELEEEETKKAKKRA